MISQSFSLLWCLSSNPICCSLASLCSAWRLSTESATRVLLIRVCLMRCSQLSWPLCCGILLRNCTCSMPCSITYVLHLNGQSQFSSTSYFLPGCSLLVSPVRLVVNHNARALRSSFWGAPINAHVCLTHQILPGKTQIFYRQDDRYKQTYRHFNH